MIRRHSCALLLLTLAALLAFGSSPSVADTTGAPIDSGTLAGRNIWSYAVQLELTNNQFYKINHLVKAHNQQILDTLTPTQLKRKEALDAQQSFDFLKMMKIIKLSVAQRSKIHDIMTAMEKDIQALSKHDAGTPDLALDNLMDQTCAIQAKCTQQVTALLTPEELRLVQSNFAQVYFKLQLTLQQAAWTVFGKEKQPQIHRMQQDANEKAYALRDDETLNDKERTAKMKDLYKDTVKQLMDVLPEEEQKQLKLHLQLQEMDPMLTADSLVALTLTDDQRAQIHDIELKSAERILAALTDDQRTQLQTLLIPSDVKTPATTNTPPAAQ